MAKRRTGWRWAAVLGLVGVSASLLAAISNNLPPVFDSTPYPVAELGQSYRYLPHASDPEGGDVGYALIASPAGMTISDQGDIAWQPEAAQLGAVDVAVTATDAWGASATQAYPLHVVADYCEIYPMTIPQSALANAPIGADLGELERGSGAGNFSWLTWGGSPSAPTLATSLLPPGDSYTYVGPTDPGDHLLEIGDWGQGAPGSMNASEVRDHLDALKTQDIIIPTWDMVRGEGNRFDYRVARFAVVRLLDYRLTGNGWLRFQFKGYKNCYNDPPVAQPQSLTSPEDTALPLQLGATDPEQDPLTFAIVSGPQHGQLAGDGAQLTYVPEPDYNGPDSFTFRASDGEFASNVATISIAVTPVNDAPTANGQALETYEDTPAAVRLLGSDIDSPSLSYRVVQGPAHGSLQGEGSDLSYVPAHNYFGDDAFTFVVNDGELDSAPATVGIHVIERNFPPVATPLVLQGVAGQPIAVELAGTDPDNDELAFRLVSRPGVGTLSGAPPHLLFQTDANFSGQVQFAYVANDGRLDSEPAMVSIQIAPSNHPPTINSTPANFVEEDRQFRYDVDATDPDAGDRLDYAMLDGDGAIDPLSGLLTSDGPGVPASGIRTLDRACRRPGAISSINPKVAWEWTSSTLLPQFNQLMSVPMVGRVTDDNGDGKIDANDNVDVIALTHSPALHQTDGIIRIFDGKTGAEKRVIAPTPYLDGHGVIALADLDNDGVPEIIAADRKPGVVAMHADGSVLWETPLLDDLTQNKVIAVADLDEDGSPEIVVGTYVLDRNGNVLWRLTSYSGRNGSGPASGIPVIADIDGDGKQEVIAGAAAYRADGTLLWRNSTIGDGYAAVGNLVGDSNPEIVITRNGSMAMLTNTGARIWYGKRIPGGGPGGAPTLGDVDGDGKLDIGVAGATRYVVYNADGSIKWASPSQDLTSGVTGSAMFDLDGDGLPEVIYNDENTLRIYRGQDGQVLFQARSTSGTAFEYPTVANIDDDPAAEIIVGTNTMMQYTKRDPLPGTQGLVVYKSAGLPWMATRSIWNQHAYHIDNVNDDDSIPAHPEKSWLTHNTYRLNAFADHTAQGLADLALFDLRLDTVDPHRILLSVRNRGLAAAGAETLVRIYDGASAAGRLLGTIPVPMLASNEERELVLGGIDAGVLGGELYAEVDGLQTVEECLEDNNGIHARLYRVRATDQGGLSDDQLFSVGATNVNEAPVFQPATPGTPRLGHRFTYRVSAVDPDLGDGLLYSLDSGPAGMVIEPVSGELRWTPTTAQVGAAAVRVRVTDLGGLTATQELNLVVPANRSPTISSAPVLQADVATAYRYDVTASDPDDDILTYSLVNAPPGLQINNSNGVVFWPQALMTGGDFDITLQVADDFGGVDTQSFRLSVSAPSNHPPQFVSEPIRSVALGRRYQYDARASDPDGDVIAYSLATAPAGMAIDTTTGTVVWQPSGSQLGEFPVVVTATDARGASIEQSYTVLVSPGLDDGNHPPAIASVPATIAQIGANYVYAIEATDLDGDALAYRVPVLPIGMTFDVATHTLHWTPGADQAGLNDVRIEVDDGRGGIAYQQFAIMAFASTGSGGTESGNHPPAITSQPLTRVKLGDTYRYYAQAVDSDGDVLDFQLLQAPVGMSIHPDTGVIAWTPTALQTATVQVAVSDGRGGVSMQSFTVTVVDSTTDVDHLPVLTAAPASSAKVGVEYCETLAMNDADGDPIQFSLLSGPEGMSVDAATGRVCWTPVNPGDVLVSVRATAGGGYVDTTWTLHVAPADTALSVQVQIAPERVAPGGSYTVTTAISGAAGPVQITATLNGLPIALDADGSTSLVAPTTPGYYTLTVTVSDGNTTQSTTAAIYVADPSDTAPPAVHLLSPDNDGRVTAPTTVTGEVTGTDVAHWSLTLIDKATGATQVLAQGDGATGPGQLTTLDPTLSINGFYTLWLQGWDQGGNRAEDFRTVLIDGDMKLGNFSLTFEDVNIPVGGIPIRVTRTYDTRRRGEPLAFGQGWSVDYQSMRVTESRTPGYAWTLQQDRNGYFGNWCVRPNGDPLVAVTLPDGKLMKFRAKAMPECQFLTPETDVQLVFEPLPGTDAQLDQTDYQNLRLATVAGSNVYNLIDLADPYEAAANPSHYRLKLPDGTIYALTQGVGITQVTAPDGNTSTYGHYGIKHSLGPEVVFARDARDRIEQVILPDGQRRNYTFTGDNDLEMSVDEAGGITSFGYDTRHPHYLRDIVDPRGIRVSRNEYDDDGRLVATIDADGHRIEYTHQLAGRTEIIKDRRGFASIYAYDEEGWVTAESNALGETTLHRYDANGNELGTTDPLGHTTSRSFDPRGNLLVETDPLGHRTVRTYNERNEVLTQTDPLGRVVATNAYNAYNGKLVSIRDASGALTTFGYDTGIGSGETGELLGIVDAEDQSTRFEVNQFGYRTREYDAQGHLLVHYVDLNGREYAQRRSRMREDGTLEYLYERYTFDAKGRITATQHPDGSVTTTDYDGNDKPVKTCDGLNRCTVQEYDARGELAKTTYPDGTWESSDYDENGNVVARTDRGGRTTKMVYDAANRLVTTILPDSTPGTDNDNPRTTNEYDAAGRMIASVDANGRRTEYGYDDAGRRTTVTDALGHVTTTAYDAAGQRVAVTDALGRTTRFEYDAAGRLIATIFPDDTAFDDDNPRVTTTYDKVGRKLTETDEMGRTKAYAYDALGRLVSVRLPNPATGALDDGALVTRYGYDELGNKLAQTDALGRITRWSYDAMGRELSRTLPLGQVESFGYDAAGQRIAHTDFKGVTTGYVYDDVGRLAGVDYAHDADVITTYTASGQRATVTDGQGTTTYAYDTRDQLRSVTTPDGNTVAYEFDAAGNRTGLHSPALDQTFDFDELNRLHAVHSRVLGGSERVAIYEYDAVGNRAALTQANGVRSEYGFDVRNRLHSLVTRTAAGAMLFAATYTVDASGLRTGIDEASAAGPTRSMAYAYDADRRLLAETIAPAGGTPRTTTWTYDAVGNRLEENQAGTVTTYTVDANDRLAQTTTGGSSTIYTYDANGNTTGHATQGTLTTTGYDDANRQTTVTTAGATTTLAYNADGLRIAETAAGRTTTWLLDPNRDYAQTLEASTDGNLATVWEYGDELLAQSNVVNGGLHETALHTDGLGSVRQASDVNGSLSDSFEYDAFGNELARTGTTDIDHRYRGEQVDPNTGFYNLRARWMDPDIGRFSSLDPWSGKSCSPITLNKYLYASANPSNNSDPSGLATLPELSVSNNIQSSMRTTTLNAGKSVIRNVGCQLVEAAAEEAITAGIYVLSDGLGNFYVGQSNDIARRLKEHALDEAKKGFKLFAKVASPFLQGQAGKDVMRIAEQSVMDAIQADGGNLINKIRAVSEKGRLYKPLQQIKAICK